MQASASLAVSIRSCRLCRCRWQPQNALANLQRQPFVDYVEPRYVPVRLEGQGAPASAKIVLPGCSTDPWTGLSAHDTTADVLPWTYGRQGISAAWTRANGKGITVASLDVGVFQSQSQVTPAGFSAGKSTGRTVVNIGTTPGGSPWTCNYGHGEAAIAAPRDGVNIVGIAWDAHRYRLRRALHRGSSDADEVAIANGIVQALAHGARILSMAFGTPWNLHGVADLLALEYLRPPNPIYVAAIGTTICIPGVTDFPANQPEDLGRRRRQGRPDDGSVELRRGDDRRDCRRHEQCRDDRREPVNRRRARRQLRWDGDDSRDCRADLVGSSELDTRAGRAASALVRAQAACQPSQRGKLQRAVRVRGRRRLRRPRISGPSTVTSGTRFNLDASPLGDGPFTYSWSTGAHTPSITVVAGGSGSSWGSYTVTVSDQTEHIHRSATAIVRFKQSGGGGGGGGCRRIRQGASSCREAAQLHQAATLSHSSTASTPDGQWRANLHAWAVDVFLQRDRRNSRRPASRAGLRPALLRRRAESLDLGAGEGQRLRPQHLHAGAAEAMSLCAAGAATHLPGDGSAHPLLHRLRDQHERLRRAERLERRASRPSARQASRSATQGGNSLVPVRLINRACCAGS